MPQTTYNDAPVIGYAGSFANSRQQKHTGSYVAEGAVVVGLLCQRGTDRSKQVKPIPALSADVDAILASGGASSASPQTIVTTALNGVVGQGRIVPAQQVSLVLSSHANWDATTAIITGEDALGRTFSENVAIPDGGNATVKTLAAFGRVTSIQIPAQTGSGGTFTVGTSPDSPQLSLADFPGIAMRDVSREPYSTANAYDSGDPCPVAEEGDVFVVTETTTVAGDDVYVRITESGSDFRGQFASAPGTGFARLHGPKFVSNAAADGVAVLRLPS